MTWLITLVENILYMTRIDNEKLVVDKQPEVVEDVVGEAVAHVPALKGRSVTVSLPEQVVAIPMYFCRGRTPGNRCSRGRPRA